MTDSPVLQAHRERVYPISSAQRAWRPGDEPLPALYLGHGAPPLLDHAEWMGELFDWIAPLPKPTGVLIVSAHWEAAPLALTSPVAGTPLVYDFSGFEQRFFQMTYATPDATGLAGQVAALMPDTEPVHVSSRRGLDHGAWVPLMAMYPLADVPVLQMSIPTHDPVRLLDLGARLRPLREQGVLIIGSGFLTHGLPYLTREHWVDPAAAPPGWSKEFDAWAAAALHTGDLEELADYAHRAPGVAYAHPTVEHFTPLFVTLGAATNPGDPATTAIDGFFMGLAKRSIQVA